MFETILMWVLPWSVIFRRFTAIMFDESQRVFSFMLLFTFLSACLSFLLLFVGIFIFLTCFSFVFFCRGDIYVGCLFLYTIIGIF